jgi:hypothetical protein
MTERGCALILDKKRRQWALIMAAVTAAMMATAPAVNAAAVRPAKASTSHVIHWKRVVEPLGKFLSNDPFTNNWVNDHSQKCLDVTGDASGNHIQMQQWGCNDDDAQFFLADTFVSPGGQQYPFFQIAHCVGSICKCVEVYNWSKSSKAEVDTWSCLLQSNGLPDQNQAWIEAGGPSGYTALENENSDMLMDVSGASTADGAHVIQYPINGGTNQYWKPT